MDIHQKQKTQQIFTIFLWIVSILLLIFLRFWYLTAFLFVLHLAELIFVGFKRGRAAGIPVVMTIPMVLIFGFTWWLYLTPDSSNANLQSKSPERD